MAEPYTPSLDEAREVYADLCERGWREGNAEFDRMIEAVRAEEREKAAQIVEDMTLFQMDGELAGRITRGVAARIREQGKEQET